LLLFGEAKTTNIAVAIAQKRSLLIALKEASREPSRHFPGIFNPHKIICLKKNKKKEESQVFPSPSPWQKKTFEV